MKVKVRLIKDHDSVCIFRRRPQENEPCWYLGTYEGLKHTMLSAAGDRRGHGWRWIEFICPYPYCTARGIVRVDTIEEAIKEAIQK